MHRLKHLIKYFHFGAFVCNTGMAQVSHLRVKDAWHKRLCLDGV